MKTIKPLQSKPFLFFFLISGLLSSCFTQIPISHAKPKNNDTYNVSYLFEHEGCKVYRFYDNGHYVYFTNCNGDVTSVEDDSTQTRVLNINRVNP